MLFLATVYFILLPIPVGTQQGLLILTHTPEVSLSSLAGGMFPFMYLIYLQLPNGSYPASHSCRMLWVINKQTEPVASSRYLFSLNGIIYLPGQLTLKL